MNAEDNPKRLNELGEDYLLGIHQEKNIEIAYSYFKQAADQENPVGYFNLSRYYLEKGEKKQALLALQKSSALGYTIATLKLSDYALKGIGQRKNKSKAFKYTQEAMKQNDVNAMNQLASYYLKGIGTKKDLKKAWNYYQKSADLNNHEGMYQLALLYLSLKQNNKNMEQALHWLDKASTALHKEAILKIRDIYLSNHKYFQKKSKGHVDEMIFYYTELLARTKDIESLVTVSHAYYFGSTVTKQNPEKAYEYYEMLATLNYREGYYGLGLCYLYQKNVEQDIQKANQLFLKASELGHANAFTKLGDISRTLGTDQIHYEAAKDYYIEAAKLNDPEGLLNLGLLHYRNQINNSTYELAFQYIDQAQKKGSPQADYWLGIFYDKGVGTKRNITLAQKHFKKAIDELNTGALFKYAAFIYENEKANKKLNKKQKTNVQNALQMFIEYIENPEASKLNKTYSYAYLAEAFDTGYGVLINKLAARLYTEKAAEANLTSHQVKMFQLLKDKEPENALYWLKKAIKNNDDGEAFYQMGLLYYHGQLGFEKNDREARICFETASKMNHKLALEKLMML